MPPDLTKAANFDPGARAGLLLPVRRNPDLDPQFRLDSLPTHGSQPTPNVTGKGLTRSNPVVPAISTRVALNASRKPFRYFLEQPAVAVRVLE